MIIVEECVQDFNSKPHFIPSWLLFAFFNLHKIVDRNIIQNHLQVCI